MKTLKGTISITSPTSNMRDSWIEIRIEDESSDCVALIARMDHAAFSKAVVNNSEQLCEYEFNDSDVIGKKREHKIEFVENPKSGATEAELKAIIKPYEKDGWHGSLNDLTNHHNVVGNKVKVVFERWI